MASSIKYFWPSIESVGLMTKVLIVEDDVGYAWMMIKKLGSFFEVESVATLKEAVEVFGKRAFGAVLLDIGLPDTKIDNTVALMKGCYPECAIVVLSGHEDPERIKRCIRDSASSYLIKGRDDKDGQQLATAINSAISNNAVYQKVERVRKEIENGSEI